MITTGTLAAAGVALAAWPFIDSMNPASDVVAISTIEIDVEQIEIGQRITAVWRGKPIFIDHRTPERIDKARADDTLELPDPQLDSERVQRDEWLVVIGICTHLGCIPMGQNPGDRRGDYGGWFCPCHGGHYDTSGRVRAGPPPRNLVVPPYRFLEDMRILIG
jgi:ubiquinol-cytochrome c reductase iron-sulfur subunit